MAGEVHSIVQNAHNFNHIRLRHPVENKMPPSAPPAREVERPQSWANLIAGDATRNVWAICQLDKGLDEYLPVPAGLE